VLDGLTDALVAVPAVIIASLSGRIALIGTRLSDEERWAMQLASGFGSATTRTHHPPTSRRSTSAVVAHDHHLHRAHGVSR
jgi:hypothetical protein